MRKSSMKILGQIKLVLMALLTLVQISLAADLPEQAEIVMKGKIFGDQLMLIDEGGRQSPSKDGIYTTQDGTKITVEKGIIVNTTMSKGRGMCSTFRIVEVNYFDTD